MKEEQIKELFDLTMRVANETNNHVSFEFSAHGSGSMLFWCVLNKVTGAILKRFEIYKKDFRRFCNTSAKDRFIGELILLRQRISLFLKYKSIIFFVRW